MKKDYQTHVFTMTYTADVSGVCSAMYELGGMSVLHDPSGCNSTYSTHDEPRRFDTDSLMYVSGLDEITAVMGDDNVLIRDVVQAAHDLQPRFITLCGASIPHIIAFDFRGVAYLIEKECGIPVLPVPTDGLKSYVSGVGLALSAWLERFADPKEYREYRASGSENGALDDSSVSDLKEADPEKGRPRINIVGATPLDFSVNGNIQSLKKCFEEAGYVVNCCMAMGTYGSDSTGESTGACIAEAGSTTAQTAAAEKNTGMSARDRLFERMQHAYRADVNVVVSSAGRKPAALMKKKSGMPFVEGLPIGAEQTKALLDAVSETIRDGISRKAWSDSAAGAAGQASDAAGCPSTKDSILVIGEEIFAKSFSNAINMLPETVRKGRTASPMWPDVDEGIAETDLAEAVRNSAVVIADPLYRTILQSPRAAGRTIQFIDFPHEAYSGRIYREDIPVFCSAEFSIQQLLGKC